MCANSRYCRLVSRACEMSAETETSGWHLVLFHKPCSIQFSRVIRRCSTVPVQSPCVRPEKSPKHQVPRRKKIKSFRTENKNASLNRRKSRKLATSGDTRRARRQCRMRRKSQFAHNRYVDTTRGLFREKLMLKFQFCFRNVEEENVQDGKETEMLNENEIFISRERKNVYVAWKEDGEKFIFKSKKVKFFFSKAWDRRRFSHKTESESDGGKNFSRQFSSF